MKRRIVDIPDHLERADARIERAALVVAAAERIRRRDRAIKIGIMVALAAAAAVSVASRF